MTCCNCNALRQCSFKMRLVLDVLQIIFFNVIHLLIELTEIHVKNPDKDELSRIRIGEYLWYLLICFLGFVALLIVFMRALGCDLPKCFLQTYYGIGSLFLIFTPSVVTAMQIGNQADPDSKCPHPDPKIESCPCCDMSPKQFRYEFLIMILTLIVSSLYIISFLLTSIREPDAKESNSQDGTLSTYSDAEGIDERPASEKIDMANLYKKELDMRMT